MVTTAGFSDMLPGVTVDLSKGAIGFFMNRPGTRFVNAFDWLTGFTVTASGHGAGSIQLICG